MRLRNFLLFFVSLTAPCIVACESLPVYVYTDFGGGKAVLGEAVSDWQTAIELASGAWKTTGLATVWMNDSAPALDPGAAAKRLQAAFPYDPGRSGETLHTLVVHVIDPGVGNDSSHPRALVWRKDGVAFVGPDNGTLTLACPKGSIAGIWEIDVSQIRQLTGSDVTAGGTFHGRDLFSLVAYLIATDQAVVSQIGKRYPIAELAHRLEGLVEQVDTAPIFEPVSTTRWQIVAPTKNDDDALFSAAYFLTIVQWPVQNADHDPVDQLFYVDASPRIAVVNRRTGNIFVGPDNGLGTAFFDGFKPSDVWVTAVSEEQWHRIHQMDDLTEVRRLLLHLPPLQKAPQRVSLVSTSVGASVLEGRIWIDAYGNIKTTLTNDQLSKVEHEGRRVVSVRLNGVTVPVRRAQSFAEVGPNEAFIYVGSSGAVGHNPQRARRYVEVSSNGAHGLFGVDLFTSKGISPYSGQTIQFILE